MSFPIQFVKPSNHFDFVSSVLNFIGNATVVAAGGGIVCTVSKVALDALGCNETVSTVVQVIPAIVTVIGASAAVAGVCCLGYMTISSSRAIAKRL